MATPVPTIIALAVAASQPAIETTPYVGDPPIVFCQCVINGATKPWIPVVNTAAGQVCRFDIPASLGVGTHNIKARVSDYIGDTTDWSPLFYFRRYQGDSGANFWTYQGAVICDPDCVSK